MWMSLMDGPSPARLPSRNSLKCNNFTVSEAARDGFKTPLDTVAAAAAELLRYLITLL